MFSTVEITHTAIRVVQCSKDSVEEIDEFPVPEGADPINTLGTISLSGSLGAVRVIIHHDDLLLGSIVQAPCPEDRLAKLIEFEMKSNLGDQVIDSLVNWYVTKTGGTGDMRILTSVTKRDLVDRINEALKVNKGRMVSIVPPGLGLYECWKAQGKNGNGILVDVGGDHTHVSIIEEGELLFLRSTPTGMNELVNDISELRSIDKDAARELVGKLNKNTPDDIKDLINRHAAGLAQNINNIVRFAQAQLKISKIEIEHLYISGSGARVPFLINACGKQLNAQAIVFNPYPRVAVSLPPSQMDTLAELPSSWGPALGTCQAESIKLDGLHQVHRETKQFRETSGTLRLAAIIAAALLIWSFVNQQLVNSNVNKGLDVLVGSSTNPGLVPIAQQKDQQLKNLSAEHSKIYNKAAFIDGERRPGRISHELISAITSIQDQNECPISLQSIIIDRKDRGLVKVTIHGRAQSVGRLDTATVISRFEEGLQEKFPFFKGPMTAANIQADTANTPSGYHAFAYELVFPDNL